MEGLTNIHVTYCIRKIKFFILRIQNIIFPKSPLNSSFFQTNLKTW